MLKQRIITALALIAGLLIVLFALPQPAVAAALALLILGGAWEWAGFFGAQTDTRVRLGYVVVLAVLITALWWFSANPDGLKMILFVSTAWWLAALVWIMVYPTPVPRVAIAICGALVLAPAWLALVRLHEQLGSQWLLFVFVVVWAADIGAYFVGRSAGRIKLAPAVSPGKTWEGVAGGLTASALAALAGAFWFGVAPARFVTVCLLVAAVSIVGDLTVSLFKRNADLKDSSSLLPGHGGILDRVDSIMAAAPVFLLALSVAGLMA